MPSDEEIGRQIGDVAISYSVKELLARIEDRQIRLDEKIAHLASAGEVERLRATVERHEARWNRVMGAALGVSLASGGVAGWLTTLLAA